MRRWRARGAWLPRLARRWRPDGNPLRRTSDRIEAVLLAILIAAFLCGAPLAGIAAGRAAAASNIRAEHAQAGVHRVAAALLRPRANPIPCSRRRWSPWYRRSGRR